MNGYTALPTTEDVTGDPPIAPPVFKSGTALDNQPQFLGGASFQSDSSKQKTLTSPPPLIIPAVGIKIQDSRKINPATGIAFKKGAGGKTTEAKPEVLRAIIAHAKAQGVDPNTALAVALQETELGRLDPNFGSAWSYTSDEGITDSVEQNANILSKAIKDKLSYAQKLGIAKRGEEYALQAYNGYGKLFPRGKTGGKYDNESYYEIPVTGDSPLDLRENPAYGKTIISLREDVIKKNQAIQKLISQTQAYKSS